MNKVILNHLYKLHHDLKRTYILNQEDSEESDLVNSQWISKIHPIFAMVLSLLSEPITIPSAIETICYFLDVEDNEAENLLLKFLDSKEPFIIDYDGFKSIFPKNIIINVSEAKERVKYYSPSEFAYTELDFKQERFYNAPLGIVYMVNNTCATDCIYCYADKSVRSSIVPFERIVEIIEEARSLDIQSFSIVGGEYFLYKRWDKLLDILIENGYKPPLISTKVPITEEVILKYKNYNLPIQISLDSLDANKLSQILGVKYDYLEKIKQTIILLDKYNAKFQISTVLTSYNNEVADLEKMHSFLSQFKNINRWEIRVGFKSLYSKEYFECIKIRKKDVMAIEKWIWEKKKSSTISLLWSPNHESKYFATEGGEPLFCWF